VKGAVNLFTFSQGFVLDCDIGRWGVAFCWGYEMKIWEIWQYYT